MSNGRESKENPGLSEARRAAKAPKGPPSEHDRPRRRLRLPRVLRGQIDIFGGVHGEDHDDRQEVDDAA